MDFPYCCKQSNKKYTDYEGSYLDICVVWNFDCFDTMPEMDIVVGGKFTKSDTESTEERKYRRDRG